PPGAARKQAEQEALQGIIDRKALASIARERKLDKTPDFLMQTRRGNELLLASLVQQQTASQVPEPSGEEVDNFIAANPAMFGDRKLLILDQIEFPIPSDRKQLGELQPLKTLDQFEQKLVADGVEFHRAPTSLDTSELPPLLAKSIATLPAGEVFVLPSTGGLTANRIIEALPSALTGEEAKRVARELVRRKTIEAQEKARLEPLLTRA